MNGGETSMGGAGASFPETRWSLIAAAGDPTAPDRGQQLSELCRAYWKPVYRYFRQVWSAPVEQAKDLTQEFFLRLLEGPLLERADPARARFRTYLKACLANFARHQHQAGKRKKRGGDARFEALDADHAESSREGPEALIDREWKSVLVQRALAALERELADRPAAFEIFVTYYHAGAGEPTEITYSILSQRFDIAHTALVNLLHRARTSFREAVRREIRDLCQDEESAREEYRELFGAEPA